MAPTLIKKYGNRRLYDTGDSRYVTLDELATKIRAGSDLRIVDAQTNEDLTQATLTQLVLETGHAAKFLPVQLLTQMIRLSDDALAEFFSRYVTGALDVYLQAKRGVQSLAAYNPLAQIPFTEALARMWSAGSFAPAGYAQPAPYPYPPPPQTQFVAPPPPPEHEPEPPPSNGGGHEGDRNDVAAMRRELDELKQLMRESVRDRDEAAAKPARKKRKP